MLVLKMCSGKLNALFACIPSFSSQVITDEIAEFHSSEFQLGHRSFGGFNVSLQVCSNSKRLGGHSSFLTQDYASSVLAAQREAELEAEQAEQHKDDVTPEEMVDRSALSFCCHALKRFARTPPGTASLSRPNLLFRRLGLPAPTRAFLLCQLLLRPHYRLSHQKLHPYHHPRRH